MELAEDITALKMRDHRFDYFLGQAGFNRNQLYTTMAVVLEKLGVESFTAEDSIELYERIKADNLLSKLLDESYHSYLARWDAYPDLIGL